MTKTLLIAASLTAVALPSVVQAQALPAAVVAVVDIEKVTSTCNACRTAITALQGQVTTLQNRERTLGTPLQTEQKSIQAAIDALAGKEPDAALKTRVQAFQTKQQNAVAELERGKQQIGLNQQYVNKQIADKIGPIYSQVMQKRGANVMVEIGTTLASGASLDVTNDVLTALNAALPSISTTAPAQAAPKQAQPQGR
jgi:Skp family chaperone for outer membrane proteins